ncbi:lebercilin [Periplaneta americana]|uniref:lebercilin n=1 Tax=Periplaneta americana TaxID=6978 RepID=UPI0037E7D26B
MESTLIEVVAQEKTKEEAERAYSNETFYTDSSEEFRSKCKSAANLLHKRRHLHPLLGTGVGDPYRAASNYGPRFIYLNSPSKSNMNGYSQKIMSAKLLRVKQLQNELTDAQFQLNELSTENRLLKTLQKRQDLALSKYESSKAELPQLIRSHNEEVRVLRAKVKQLRSQCREKDHKIKELDADLQSLRDQHRHLLKLSRERNLGDREQLTKQVEDLKEIIKDQDIRIQTLNRKVILETKNYKHQLSTEVARQKELQRDLNAALDKIAKLETLVDTKDKYIATFIPKRNFRSHNKHSVSMVSLAGPSRFSGLHPAVKSEAELIPKLEEESSEGTYMASHTNTSFGSTHPSIDAVQTISENKLPSDGYNARRIKLANKRSILLGSKKHDMVNIGGRISPSPSSSSVLNDDRDTDPLDDSEHKQPYSFGTACSSRKSSLNTEASRKFSLEEEQDSSGNSSLEEQNTPKRESMTKSRSMDSLEEEQKNPSVLTAAGWSEDTNVHTSLSDLRKNVGRSESPKVSALSKSRKGSIIKEDISMPAVLNKNSSCSSSSSLKSGKRHSVQEECMPAISNKFSSRRGSLKQEKRHSLEIEAMPAIINRRGSHHDNITVDTNKTALDSNKRGDHVIDTTSAIEEKNEKDTISESKFSKAADCIAEISQTWERIKSTIETEREITKAKLKQLEDDDDDDGDDSLAFESKGYEKEKLLAALKAIDDGEDPVIINHNDKNSSDLNNLLTNSMSGPSSSSHISLPFIGHVNVSRAEWESKMPSSERSVEIERPKTKSELMQELFGDFTARNNNV